jgi:pyruvate/2-oxoglutarate/acetoin dehydrogenase E1 component
MTGRETLREALRTHLAAGGIVLGEAAGSHGLTEGLSGSGLRRTPLSENGTVGEAVGAALTGASVVVELLDPDGLARAGEALADAGALACRSGGTWSAPVVVIAPFGAAVRSAGGVDLHALALPEDTVGCLERSRVTGRPSVLLTCDAALDGDVPQGAPADASPTRTLRAGSPSGVTVIAAGPGVTPALEACEGRDVTLLQLRALVPMDTAAIGKAVAATGRVVVVELPEVLAHAVREAFLHLESPPALARAEAPSIAAAIDAAIVY